jgi:hypothetical protein
MRQLLVLLIPTGLVLATGCTITGKWTLETIKPEAGLHEFDYANLTFQKDGSFYGEALNPGVRATAGTYTYNHGTLILTPYDGPRLACAARIPDPSHLHVDVTTENERIQTVFKRVE